MLNMGRAGIAMYIIRATFMQVASIFQNNYLEIRRKCFYLSVI